jgi:DNA-binding MurR/RpiR family transcriptional regulator
MKASVPRKTLSVRQRIINSYPQLSPQEKRVADHILKRGRALLAPSTSELAHETGVGSATVVRFAKHVGFSGFQQLKSQVMDEVKEEMVPEDRFKLLNPEKDHVRTLLKVAELEVNNINLTLEHISRENFEAFMQALRQAQVVFSLGIGISSLLARLATYLLNQAGIRTQYLGREEHTFIERLVNLRPHDALLAFSFPPYSRETVEAVKFCAKRGVTCLSVTDRPTAPIVAPSSTALIVETKNLMFTNSISAVTMLLNAMATELALLNKRKVVSNIDILNELPNQDYLDFRRRRLNP